VPQPLLDPLAVIRDDFRDYHVHPEGLGEEREPLAALDSW